jgi:zinc protease
LYPDHAYGRSATPESIEAISRDALERFHREHYGAGGASLAIVGDLGRNEAEALAQKLTAKLPASGSPPPIAAPGLPAGGEQRIAHPAAQAHVLIGLPAVRRGDPDFFALQVGNYTLGGGGFVSRLMREVREKRGFAYSVYSAFIPLAQPGPFQIGLQTRKEQAGEAVRVAREVLARFLDEGPDEAELLAARQYLRGSFPLRFDSNRKLLDNVAAIGFYGLPLDYLDTYIDQIDKLTAAEVRAAFARHVGPENLVTVVVGDE